MVSEKNAKTTERDDDASESRSCSNIDEKASAGRPTDSPTIETEKDGKDLEAAQTQKSERQLSYVKLALIGLAIWMSIFLYSLDQTIVSNAIPSITDEFKSPGDIGWYGSGYLLTTAAFQLFYGRLYSNFSIKYTFLAAIFIFELGSLVCALAPTSTALIVGRAVAGIGAAGLASGAMVLLAHSFPPRIRPMCIASIGIVFAVAAVLGPILGGLFTSRLTWRWVFWINLPFGGATMAVVLLLLPDPERPEIYSKPISERLKKIDLIGTMIVIPAIVCLLLALQWGGSTYSWSDGRNIALLVLFAVLGAAFLAFEYWKGADASLPVRMMTNRSIAAASLNGFCNLGNFLLLVYYIPFWHQVIRDVSPEDAGIALLPLVLGVVIMANIAGALVTKYGYYTPFMILSSIITPVGVGLLTTWKVDTPFGFWVGSCALTGIGLGLGQQQPLVAMQTVLPKAEIASGTSIIMLIQTLSGAIFVSVGQSVLQNEFTRNLMATVPSGDLNMAALLRAGAGELRSFVPTQYLAAVLAAYNGALTQVYTVALCLSAITIIGSLTIEWKDVKKVKA